MKLYWHDYTYFDYEKKLALLEVKSLFNPSSIEINDEYVELDGVLNSDDASRLVYFSKAEVKTKKIETLQYQLESTGAGGANLRTKQATRYSVHGIHEYKGKFNPQVVRATLNILGVPSKHLVLDPFCGSGTTLVECFFGDYDCIGIDNNPMAALIANSKIDVLQTPPIEIKETCQKIIQECNRKKKMKSPKFESTPRSEYLLNWFPIGAYTDFEIIKSTIDELTNTRKSIYYVLASNLLRKYSYQEPSDLRIRRRFSPFPHTPIFEAYVHALNSLVNNLTSDEKYQNKKSSNLICHYADSSSQKSLSSKIKRKKIVDASITSPPYAMALPYIDMQRLSLVWLDMCNPSEIKHLDQNLIGSRDFLQQKGNEWEEAMFRNSYDLPDDLHSFCLELSDSISKNDGFRRLAVPHLLYRYLVGMSKVFRNIHPFFKENAPFALIIGHNSTTLGGKHIDIDTPNLLMEVALSQGWKFEKKISLDAYYRYALHKKNSITSEDMLILRK